MAILSGTTTLSYTDLYTSFTEVPGPLQVGALVPGPAGKWFRLSLVGAVALVMGNLLQSSAIDTQFTNMAVPVNAIGANPITVTNGTTTVTANQFDGGSLSIYTAGGIAIGDEYTIMGHTTGTSGASLTLTLDRPLRTATTTAAKVNMRRSPWSGVIQSPATTLTGSVAGVALYATAASVYAFIQTHGVGAALSDGTSILVGSAIAGPSGTAGAVTLSAAGLADVGMALQAAASAHAIGVHLQID